MNYTKKIAPVLVLLGLHYQAAYTQTAKEHLDRAKAAKSCRDVYYQAVQAINKDSSLAEAYPMAVKCGFEEDSYWKVYRIIGQAEKKGYLTPDMHWYRARLLVKERALSLMPIALDDCDRLIAMTGETFKIDATKAECLDLMAWAKYVEARDHENKPATPYSDVSHDGEREVKLRLAGEALELAGQAMATLEAGWAISQEDPRAYALVKSSINGTTEQITDFIATLN